MSTAVQQYITVNSNLIVRRGIYQVVLNYYDATNQRQQKWRSLGIKAITGNKNIAKNNYSN